MLQPSCQYGVYPVRRVLRPLSPCAFICHTLTQSRHRPTRCFVEGGRLAVACSRFRFAARLKVRLFVGRVSSFRAHDPKQLYGASVDLSSPAACPSRARPWDVRVELFLASFHIIKGHPPPAWCLVEPPGVGRRTCRCERTSQHPASFVTQLNSEWRCWRRHIVALSCGSTGHLLPTAATATANAVAA